MDIELQKIKIRELVEDYTDNEENGVFGFNSLLNIRPSFQREFIYKDAQRNAVIETVLKNFPLNVMYWSVKNKNNYEIIDGQQRTVAICKYIQGDFSVNKKYFHNLENDEKSKILNYELDIYFCSGTDNEKLNWFKTINIAGEKLADQELRNAVYSGPWITDAKRYFSKRGCVAFQIGNNYLKGNTLRQDFLETVLKWVCGDFNIEEFMASHQHDREAKGLWEYFQRVINWTKENFKNYRKEMKGLPWGEFYNKYKDKELNPEDTRKEISILMEDEDVTNKKGIYAYILNREEKHLNIRTFTLNQKREAYERQNGICHNCRKKFSIKEMEADHVTPWSLGGKTVSSNCQMLCKECNRIKTNK